MAKGNWLSSSCYRQSRLTLEGKNPAAMAEKTSCCRISWRKDQNRGRREGTVDEAMRAEKMRQDAMIPWHSWAKVVSSPLLRLELCWAVPGPSLDWQSRPNPAQASIRRVAGPCHRQAGNS